MGPIVSAVCTNILSVPALAGDIMTGAVDQEPLLTSSELTFLCSGGFSTAGNF